MAWSPAFNCQLAAVDYAATQGATIVEGYPIAPTADDVPDIYAFTGFLSTFLAAGFVEVARRSQRKPIMRLYLRTDPPD